MLLLGTKCTDSAYALMWRPSMEFAVYEFVRIGAMSARKPNSMHSVRKRSIARTFIDNLFQNGYTNESLIAIATALSEVGTIKTNTIRSWNNGNTLVAPGLSADWVLVRSSLIRTSSVQT